MKKESQVSPLMLEILVVTLFLALSASVLMQLIAKARDISVAATWESRALILLEDTLETCKADPVGDNAFDFSGVRTFSTEHDGVTVSVVVTRTVSDAGAYYRIEAEALSGGQPLLALTTARYCPRGEVTP